MAKLFTEQMLVLFAILAIGSWVGQWSIRGLSLGAAGVLFTALAFGHFGLSVPKEVMDLGLLLFVYAVGITAGPRFFRTFRRRGIQFVVIALITVGVGALTTVGVAYLFRLPYELAAGLYTGAMTCTPALAAAIDVVERAAPGSSAPVSVGYGIAYPYSMIGVVLLIQLMPGLLRRSVKAEEARWEQEKSSEAPHLEIATFVITNPNCFGKHLAEMHLHSMVQANITRIKRDGKVHAASPDFVLQPGDVVMAVGSAEELHKMRLLLGEDAHAPDMEDASTGIVFMDMEVREEALTGKSLTEMQVWSRYGVLITRIRRQGLEFTPSGKMSLEMGDNIRVVGETAAAEAFARLVQGSERKGEETNMVTFFFGLLLGILVGSIPINLPNGLTVRLGMAGGAFIVSLLVGHFGRIGPFKLYVPRAARSLSRELGLMLFLAGAGVNAGAHFAQILQQQGWSLLLAGALITTTSVAAGILLMHGIYRMNLLATMGALCACMTNPPGLGSANAQTETDLPALSYASVYPVALIFKILLAQLLVEVLRRIL